MGWGRRGGGWAHLETADEIVLHNVLEEGAAFVVVAGPAPHVLLVAVRLARMQHGGRDDPHDGAEKEKAEGEAGVVDGCFLRFVVPTSPVAVEDEEAHRQGYAGDAEDDDLRPRLLTRGPGGEVVARGQSFRGVEDGEGGTDHGEDDETAAEVDAAEEEFGDADSGLDFLSWALAVALLLSHRHLAPYQVYCVLLLRLLFLLLQDLFFLKSWTSRIEEPAGRSWRLESALHGRTRSQWHLDAAVLGHLALREVAKADIRWLWLWGEMCSHDGSSSEGGSAFGRWTYWGIDRCCFGKACCPWGLDGQGRR